jgi:predicted dehydrogenase
VRNLPAWVSLLRTNRRGGVVEQRVQPSWSDSFLEEWKAFVENVRRGREPKTSPRDFRDDLELLIAMVALMR